MRRVGDLIFLTATRWRARPPQPLRRGEGKIDLASRTRVQRAFLLATRVLGSSLVGTLSSLPAIAANAALLQSGTLTKRVQQCHVGEVRKWKFGEPRFVAQNRVSLLLRSVETLRSIPDKGRDWLKHASVGGNGNVRASDIPHGIPPSTLDREEQILESILLSYQHSKQWTRCYKECTNIQIELVCPNKHAISPEGGPNICTDNPYLGFQPTHIRCHLGSPT